LENVDLEAISFLSEMAPFCFHFLKSGDSKRQPRSYNISYEFQICFFAHPRRRLQAGSRRATRSGMAAFSQHRRRYTPE
jgi:hypothetical protein